MNVYDFDGTIYDGDSSVDFYLYCLKHKLRLIKYIPKQIKAILLYKLKKIDKTEMKERFFSFLNKLENKEKILNDFWDEHEKYIKKWYISQQKEDDLIISASPEFLLKPICERLKIKRLIASKVDINTGKFEGKNVKGEEKVNVYRKIYKEQEIKEFYSDSETDEPLAEIAQKAYMVNGDKIEEWEKYEEFSYFRNLKKNLLFILSGIISVYLSLGANTLYVTDYSKIITIIIATIAIIVYAMLHESLFKEFKKTNRFIKVLSIFATLGINRFYISMFYENLPIDVHTNFFKIVFYIIAFVTMMPFGMILFGKIYSFLYEVFKDIFKEITKKEIIIIVITFVLLVGFLIYIFLTSNLFYATDLRYDIVYYSDSMYLLENNNWLNIIHEENDLRQPLFAVYSMPFLAPLYLVFFMLFGLSKIIEPMLIGIMNIVLIIISAYMFSKIVESKERRIYFYILYLCSFAPLLFSIVLEQYPVAVFWIILLIYMYMNKIKNKKIAYIGAAGTLSTSAILFPLLTSDKRIIIKLKEFISSIIYGIGIILIFGRLELILKINSQINNLMRFTGVKLTLFDKFIQYSHFIVNSIVSINGTPLGDKWGTIELSSINWIGISLLAFMIISFIVNRKKKIIEISFIWTVFSFILLCILGWGTKNNELVLYILYFSWAFLTLIYSLLKRVFIKFKIEKVFYISTCIISGILLIYNVMQINNIAIYLSQFN